jgi:hypothetical protein
MKSAKCDGMLRTSGSSTPAKRAAAAVWKSIPGARRKTAATIFEFRSASA